MARAQIVELLLAGFTDNSGNPLSAGKVYTYANGTTTDKATWLDAGKVTQAANPIILDSNGRKQIYADGNYKFQINTSADAELYTFDELFFGIPDGAIFDGGTSSGAANTYNITLAPAVTGYATGMLFTFTSHQNNTGAATVNLNSLGAKNFAHALSASIPLTGGEIINGQAYLCRYDGSVVRILAPSSQCIDKKSSTTTIVSSSAEATLYTYTLPANILCPFRAARITAYGDIANTTGGNVAYTFRLKLGASTTYTAGPITVGTGANRAVWQLEGYIQAFTASTQKCDARLTLTTATANAGAGVQAALPYVGQLDSLALDSTGTLALVLTGQMDTSSASCDVRIKESTLEIL